MYNLQTIDETKNLFLSNSVDDLFSGIKSLHEVGKSADILKAGLLAKTRMLINETGSKKVFANKCEEFGLSKTSADMYANNFLIAYNFVLDENGNYIGIESKNPYLENFTISSLTEISTLISQAIETDKLEELCDMMRDSNCHYMTQAKLRKWRKDFGKTPETTDEIETTGNEIETTGDGVETTGDGVETTTDNESHKPDIIERPTDFIQIDGALLYDTLIDMANWIDESGMRQSYKEHLNNEIAKLFNMIP